MHLFVGYNGEDKGYFDFDSPISCYANNQLCYNGTFKAYFHGSDRDSRVLYSYDFYDGAIGNCFCSCDCVSDDGYELVSIDDDSSFDLFFYRYASPVIGSLPNFSVSFSRECKCWYQTSYSESFSDSFHCDDIVGSIEDFIRNFVVDKFNEELSDFRDNSDNRNVEGSYTYNWYYDYYGEAHLVGQSKVCFDRYPDCYPVFKDFFIKHYDNDSLDCSNYSSYYSDCLNDFMASMPQPGVFDFFEYTNLANYHDPLLSVDYTFTFTYETFTNCSEYDSNDYPSSLDVYNFSGNNRAIVLDVEDYSVFDLNLYFYNSSYSGISISDGDYLVVLNLFDSSYAHDKLLCDLKIDEYLHYNVVRQQIIGAIKVENGLLYLVEHDYINSSDWGNHAFMIPEGDNISVSDFYFNGDIVYGIGSNSVVNPNKKCAVELVRLGDFMACSDECMLDLISAIEGLTTVIDDNGGEINTNLASIDDALRNFGQFISFPRSYDINVKEVPCIDFCGGATIKTSTTVSADSTITLSPLSSVIVSSMPGDYLTLISSIISALGNLLKPSDTLHVQVAAGSTIVQNNVPVPSVTVSPAAVTVTNNVPTPSVTVNTPDSVSIDSIPCIEFCGGASLAINSLPSSFERLFKTACGTGIGEAFSEAFNLTNCIGSVFKANDNIWNEEDTIAGIWFKQLDYSYLMADNSRKSAFWLCDLYNSSVRYVENIMGVFKQLLCNSVNELHDGYSVFKTGGAARVGIANYFKRAFFVTSNNVNDDAGGSVFSFNLNSNFNNYKILNHACNVNPNSIKFCENIPFEMPTPEVTVTNNVPVPSVTNNIPVPSVTNNVPVPSVTNNVPVPSVDVSVSAPNVNVTNNVPEAPVLPDNIFINADGKTFLNNNNFR